MRYLNEHSVHFHRLLAQTSASRDDGQCFQKSSPRYDKIHEQNRNDDEENGKHAESVRIG